MTPSELAREWARLCAARIESALADTDMQQAQEWRDAKLLQILDMIASNWPNALKCNNRASEQIARCKTIPAGICR